jgi:hypothetical protein
MPAIPRKLLRSLPTLTEVVSAPPVLSDRVAAAAPQSEVSPDSEAIIERVMQRLDLSLESHVRAVVESVFQEQLREVQARLKQKVGVAVRQSVSKAVAAELKEKRPGQA